MEKPLHPNYVTVWAAVSCQGVIGPFFMEDEQERHVTVNSNRYLSMLVERFYPAVPNKDTAWLQQDGATAHTTIQVRNWLQQTFPARHISRLTNFPWPARSPDLSVMDFFVWGFIKDKVFADNHQELTIHDLKTAIIAAFASIDNNMLCRAFDNFIKRCQECVDNNGRHVHNIFHHTAPVHIC